MVKKVKIGDKYGRLLIIDDLGIYQKPNTMTRRHHFKCKCLCGKEKIISKSDIISGKVVSCGCYGREKSKQASRRYNDYFIYKDIVFVKFSNSNEYFLCDLDDLHYVKNHCWYRDKHGYPTSNKNKKRISFHRMILNAPLDKEVDHIFQISNGVCDNRKMNLRICTHQENMNNVSQYKNNSSGHTGVYYDKSKKLWMASISVKGKNKYLGLYKTKDGAIKARVEGEIMYREII